jgi:hypothetical protein
MGRTQLGKADRPIQLELFGWARQRPANENCPFGMVPTSKALPTTDDVFGRKLNRVTGMQKVERLPLGLVDAIKRQGPPYDYAYRE